MMHLITSPEAWAALLTLTALEIVLGIDNVIFLSVIVSRIPEPQALRARQIGLALALIFRIILLSVLVWLIGLTAPVFSAAGYDFSWRDLILIGGGLFLIAKATHEIHAEVEVDDGEGDQKSARSAFFWVIVQIIVIDIVFSLDSIITAIGMPNFEYDVRPTIDGEPAKLSEAQADLVRAPRPERWVPKWLAAS